MPILYVSLRSLQVFYFFSSFISPFHLSTPIARARAIAIARAIAKTIARARAKTIARAIVIARAIAKTIVI
jgi:predicted nucleotidyltransferase component of viral defense system